MKKLLFTLFTLIAFFSNAQFQTGTLTITFNDATRTGGFGSGGGAGRQIQSEVYYPATAAGSNVAVATGTFPVVVIGHGFVMDWNSYDNIYSMLSKRGYIVVMPRTEGSASPNHGDFGKDLALVGNKMLQLNNTNTLAPIFVAKVSQKLAIGGHSMGGGSSFLGASNNSTLTSLFNFAAAQTNPRSSQAAKTVTVPTLIIGGQADCVAGYATNQSVMWDSTASTKKYSLNIKNLTHCDFGNGGNTNCVLGQNLSFCGSTVSNTLALKMYMNFLNPFLDATLKENCNAATMFMDSVNGSSVIFSKKLQGSLLCNTTKIANYNSLLNLQVYPNPANDYVTIQAQSSNIKASELLTIDGRVINNQINFEDNKAKLSIQNLEKGIYLLRIIGQNNQITSTKIIKN